MPLPYLRPRIYPQSASGLAKQAQAQQSPLPNAHGALRAGLSYVKMRSLCDFNAEGIIAVG